MVHFIHTSDLQIGMPFIKQLGKSGSIQSMKSDRIEAISSIRNLVDSGNLDFVLVCGDLFDSSIIDEPTIIQTCNKINEIQKNVYVLAGNHEWKDTNTNILENELFLKHKPKNLIVLQPGINEVNADVEIFAVPLTGTHNQMEVFELLNQVPSPSNKVRILALHGQVDRVIPMGATLIKMETLLNLLNQGRVHYVALGDRHSTRDCEGTDEIQKGMNGRIYYSGAPEPTDYDEINQGYVLKVSLDLDSINVDPVKVGKWKFIRVGTPSDRIVIDDKQDLKKLFDSWKSESSLKTAVKIYCAKYLDIAKLSEFEANVSEFHDSYFASFKESEKNPVNKVPLEVDSSEINPLNLSGFMLETYQEIREKASSGNEFALEALKILHRLELQK